MSKKPDNKAAPDYLAPYQEAVDTGGAGFDALLWNSRESQATRFATISDLVDLTGRIVLDAGCGTGDFGAWLHEHDVQYGRYVGLEAIDELIDLGRKRDLPEAEWAMADFVRNPEAFRGVSRTPDVIAFSGSLNTMEQATAERVLDRAWEVATEALVFNFLSDRPGPRYEGKETGPARRLDTMALISWALARTPHVAFRQDYLHGNDATIAMRRQ